MNELNAYQAALAHNSNEYAMFVNNRNYTPIFKSLWDFLGK